MVGMGGGKRLLATRTRLAIAAFAILVAAAPSRAPAQGPQREVPADARTDGRRRRQAGADLASLGVQVDWRLASARELNDWVVRASRARLLRERFGVNVDWRTFGAPELADFEARLARVANLRRYGVSVDWRLYGAAQLDELLALLDKQRAWGALQPPAPPSANAAAARFDPDDVLLPTYVAEELARDNDDDDDDDVLPPTVTNLGRPSRPEDRPLPPSRGTR